MNISDVDLAYTLTIVNPTPAERIFHHAMLRIPAADAPYPANGYDLYIRENGASLEKVTGWSGTSLGSVAGFTLTQGTAYKVRFQAQGIALRVKVWLASGSEPSAWQIDVTDTTYATGFVGFQTVGGASAAVNYQTIIDDIVMSNPSGGQSVDITVTAQAKPGYTLQGGATTTWTHTFS